MPKVKQAKLQPGLCWRGQTIHVDTTINGIQVRKTTGTDNVNEANMFLDQLKMEVRYQNLTGNPGKLTKTWADAVVRYFETTNHKRQKEEKSKINYMTKFIPLGQPLNQIFNSTLEPMRQELKAKGRKAACVNSYLKLVRQILNKAMKWEEAGIRWLTQSHNIVMEPEKDNQDKAMNRREPYPISWEEQDRLFAILPPHLYDACLFLVNTGLREKEAANLRWQWLVHWEELDATTFVIPGSFHKNKQSKIVVLNSIAREVIERQRGKHSQSVFTYPHPRFGNQPVKRFNASAWRKARERVGLKQVRVHDLRHTFAHRLKAYGVGYEDRAVLLGHKVDGVTADYSFTALELESMIANAEKIVKRKKITFLRPKTLEKEMRNPQISHSADTFCGSVG